MIGKIIIIEYKDLSQLFDNIQRIDNLNWLYMGEQWPIYNSLDINLSQFCKAMPIGQLINDKAQSIRREFLNYENILDGDLDTLFWQTTSISEKNPLNSPFFIDICSTLIFKDIIQDYNGNLLIVIDDIVLGGFLLKNAKNMGWNKSTLIATDSIIKQSDYFSNRKQIEEPCWQFGEKIINNFFGNYLEQKKLYDSVVPKIKKIEKGSSLDILTFVWGTPNTFDKYIYKKEDFLYGCLPQYLLQAEYSLGYFVSPMLWVHSLEAIIKNISKARDKTITIYDCVDIEDAYIKAKKAFEAKINLKSKLSISKTDFTELFIKRFYQEKTSDKQCWSMLYYQIGKHLRDSNIKVRNVIAPYENQPWEKALRLGIKDYLPDTKICQYASGNIEDLWLSAYPGEKDFKNSMIPDVLSVLSHNAYHKFKKTGYPESKLKIWPAFRYEHIFTNKNDDVIKFENNTIQLLVATSTSLQSSIELLSKTIIAIKNIRNLSVRVRLHPRVGSEVEIMNCVNKICNTQQLPNNITVSNARSLEDDLHWANAVALSGTGLEYEASFYGCYTIFVRSQCNLDMNSMDYQDHDKVVQSIEGLHNTLTNLSNQSKIENKTTWQDERCDYHFQPITNDGIKDIVELFGYSDNKIISHSNA